MTTRTFQSSQQHKLSSGFTLVEILVVLAIVALLAAIGFSAISRFSESGKEAATASRLKQLYTLQMAYAQDNNGRMTPFFNQSNPNTWQSHLFAYLHLVTSSRTDPKLVLNSPYHKAEGNKASFGMNSFMVSTNWNYSIIRVPALSKVIMAGDMTLANQDYMHTSDGKDNWGGSGKTWALPAYRHAGKKKAMMVFMDGHTELLGEDDLKLTPPDGSPSRWKWWP